jgi:hypothetical protein
MKNLGQRESLINWRELVGACESDPELSADLQPHLAVLVETAEEAESTLLRRDHHHLEAQVATHQLVSTLKKGHEQAMHIRLRVKAAYGPRDKRLLQFGIKPLRALTRRCGLSRENVAILARLQSTCSVESWVAQNSRSSSSVSNFGIGFKLLRSGIFILLSLAPGHVAGLYDHRIRGQDASRHQASRLSPGIFGWHPSGRRARASAVHPLIGVGRTG